MTANLSRSINVAKSYLDGLRFRVEAGLVSQARRAADRAEPVVARFANESERETYRELTQSLSELQAIEYVYGRGSALNLEHLAIKDFIRAKRLDGTPLLSDAVIQSARHYQMVKAGGMSYSKAEIAKRAERKEL